MIKKPPPVPTDLTMEDLGLECSDAAPKMPAEELFRRLDAKFPPPAWLMLREVRDATGFGACRSADAMAFGVWPSRGLAIIGFEIKSARADWLRELKAPEKAESIARSCDEWWLVAGKGVAKSNEIPKNWGWLEPKGRGLTVMKAAVENGNPALPRELLMSVVRKMTESYVPKSAVDRDVRAAAEHLAKTRYDERGYELERLQRLAVKVREFSAASGINIDGGDWGMLTQDWKTIGNVVRAVLSNSLVHQIDSIREAAKAVDEAMDAVLGIPLFAEVKAVADVRKRKRAELQARVAKALEDRLRERASTAAAKLRELGYKGIEATDPLPV